jgi:hypothetical protein
MNKRLQWSLGTFPLDPSQLEVGEPCADEADALFLDGTARSR